MLNLIAHMDDLYGTGGIYSAASVSINWWAIIIAVLSAIVIGTLWYGPLFGKRWMKLVNLRRGSSSPVAPMLIMLGLAFVQAFVLAHFIDYARFFYTDYSDLSVGLLTGLWAFVGFILPVLVSNTIFAKGSIELLKINLGNQFVTLLVIGAIIGVIN